MNSVFLVGRLVKDPELKNSKSDISIASFRIAVDRRSKEKQTDFFSCTAFRSNAEFIANYGAKGRLVGVQGRIEIREVTNDAGEKRSYTDIVCDNVQLLDSKKDAEDLKSTQKAAPTTEDEFDEEDPFDQA